MSKKFLSMLLVFAMICTTLPMHIFAAEGDSTKFSVTAEFYDYTPGADPEGDEPTLGTTPIDINNGVEVGQYFAIKVDYNNIAQLAPYGLSSTSWSFTYDSDMVEPAYIQSKYFAPDKPSQSYSESTLTDAVEYYMADNGIPPETYIYSFSDKLISGTTRRVMMNINRSDFLEGYEKKDDGSYGILPFKAKKTGTAVFALGADNSTTQVTPYADSTGTPADVLNAGVMVGDGDMVAPLSYSLSVLDYSAEPIVQVEKDYDDDTTTTEGALATSSKLVIEKLVDETDPDGSGKEIPAGTVIKLYEASSTVDTDGKIALDRTGKSAIASVSIDATTTTAEFLLNGSAVTPATATTDYIVTATEPDLDESKGVPVVAATGMVKLVDEAIAVDYNRDSANPAFAADSFVRVYELYTNGVNSDTVSVDENTVLNLYVSDSDQTADDATLVSDAVISHDSDDNGSYVQVQLEGLDSTKTYYLTATQNDRPESVRKIVIKKQSYLPDSATTKATNNYLKNTDHEIIVSNLLNEKGELVPVTANTAINVYSQGSISNDNMITGATSTAVTDDDGNVTIKVTVPYTVIPEEGGNVYITAKETGYLESTAIEVKFNKAGNQIIGLIDPETGSVVIGDTTKTLSDADKQRVEAEKANLTPVGATVIVPEGTHKDSFADFGLTTGKVAVLLESEIDVTDSTGSTVKSNVAFVDIDAWTIAPDVLDTDDNAIVNDPADPDAESYTYVDAATTTFVEASLTALELVASADVAPKNSIQVTKKPVIVGPVEPGDPEVPTLEEGAHTVPNPVIVPDGTPVADLDKFGLSGNTVAVRVEPAVKDADGNDTNIVYVDINWNTGDDLPDPIVVEGDSATTTDYPLTGTFDQTDLDALGITASDLVYQPNTVVQAVKSPVGSGVVDEDDEIYPPLPEPDNKPEQDVIDDIAIQTDVTRYKEIIYVTEGTTKADAIAMLETDKKLPVIVYTTQADGTIKQSASYIGVEWNTDALPTTFTANEDGYAATGSFKTADLTAAGITVSPTIETLTTIFMVVDAPEIQLYGGNILATDTDYAAEDIFVYRYYTFADPGVGVKNADGSTTEFSEIAANVTREYVQVDYEGNEIGTAQTLDAYATGELLDDFSTLTSSDYSKIYKLTYTYTDPVTKLTATASRNIYAIYQLGDVDRSGAIGEEVTQNDSNRLNQHTMGLSLITLTDNLYTMKTANADKQHVDDEIITQNDANRLNQYTMGLSDLTQLYPVNETIDPSTGLVTAGEMVITKQLVTDSTVTE